jgi:hypothetical protein
MSIKNTDFQENNSENEYKKAMKKLREIECLINKKTLTKEEREKVEKKSYYKNIINSHNKIKFTDLPDDVLFIIISYLPLNVRLNILRKKYTFDFISNKIKNIRGNHTVVKKLFYYATSVNDILSESYFNNEGYTKYYSEWLNYYHKDAMTGADDVYLKRLFSDMILHVIKNYVKMYKNKQLKDKYLQFEKKVFYMYYKLLFTI